LRKVAAGIAVATPRASQVEFSHDRQTRHSHGSYRPGRQKPGRSPSRKGSKRHSPGPHRVPDNTSPGDIKSGHFQKRNTGATEHDPRADQSKPRKNRSTGSTGSPPRRVVGLKRPRSSVEPVAQPARTRRIIGLEPETPAVSRQSAQGRSIPKRLPARKPQLRLRRPPGQRPLRASPKRVDELEGEDA
jgi:hypothetical protein